MTIADETSEYNQVAIETAARLHDLRRSEARTTARAGRPLQELLPPTVRTAVGVMLEWERMGERHVSAQLEARAEALGAGFEHL